MASLISLAHERDIRVLHALLENQMSPLWVVRLLATEKRADIRERAMARLRAMGADPAPAS
jgi:hypothetical protein